MNIRINPNLYKERFITVTDDWYPCYPNQRVVLNLSFYKLYKMCKTRYIIKLTAFGMDDTGVEIEHTTKNKKVAIGLYQELENMYNAIPDGVDMQWFFAHGFELF